MSDKGPRFSYKETKLNLDSSTLNSTIAIRLPKHGALSFTRSQKSSQITDLPVAEDEKVFRQRHIATAASIYYRSQDNFPRSYLWRVLEDGKVLSIQAVDTTKQQSLGEAPLTLRLTFPSSIKPGCVAFSDCDQHDFVSAFVLTDSNHLYTLRLWPDFFRNPAATEDNVSNWCKSYISSVFSFKKPHRMVAISPNELLISNMDGGLLKLDRKSGGDGLEWKETHYHPGGWRDGLMSLIPFQGSNTRRYGNTNIDLSTVTSIASPASKINGLAYAFTVSLDHNLRIWNLSTGKIAYIGDILGQEVDPKLPKKNIIDPAHSQLIKVYEHNGESAVCVTYSPNGAGQFKFWSITPDGEGLEVTDIFPNNTLVPRVPTSDVWTMADFAVVIDRANANALSLWTLWKYDTTYRVQKLYFLSGPPDSIDNFWQFGWEAMASETLPEKEHPIVYHGDSADSTDKWLEYILYPGRFSRATIETGLLRYMSSLGISNDSVRKSGPLPERLCSTIASTATLNRGSNGGLDYEQFRVATDAQWLQFYRLLLSLDKPRSEALSLVIDPRGDMPWVVSADGLSAIRDASQVDKIWHNLDNPSQMTAIAANLVIAAASFRDAFPDSLAHSVRSALLAQIFEEPQHLPEAMMKAFYDACDFGNQISNDDYDQLQNNLGGSFQDVTHHVFEDLLECMMLSTGRDKHPLPLADFGNKLIVRGVQETVELYKRICLDQLVLLIFIEGELNHTEEVEVEIETGEVFNQFLAILRRLELVSWLAKTQIDLPLPVLERRNSINEQSSLVRKPTPHETITVLEGVHRHLFCLEKSVPMSQALTGFISELCKPDSRYESSPATIQYFLLKYNRPDLAMEFARFAEHDAFSTYTQGRVYLAANDPHTAAQYFKKAAFGMGYPDARKRSNIHSSGFIDEYEKHLLNAGLPEYYSHIVALYDKEKLHSFVIDFSRLALQFIKPDTQNTQLRTDMHCRLFTAALQTSRYDLAHSALILLSDPALQTSSLRQLITKMCESNSTSQLINLPLIGLHDLVDDILVQKCQSIIEVTSGIAYHKILYAWRIKRSDFRGAAAISLDRLHRLKGTPEGDKMLGEHSLETPVTRQYVAVINALSCVDPKQAWILCEGLPARGKKEVAKRKVVTLEDVRRGYQEELDRLAAIENNQFAFGDGDEMDLV